MQKVKVIAVVALLALAVIVPSLSIDSIKGQTGQANYSSQGSLIVQVLYPNPPTTNWQTPHQYPVTFQIMKNGTVNLTNQTDLYPNGYITVDVQITTIVTQYFSSYSYTYDANTSFVLNPSGFNTLGAYPASNVTEYYIREIAIPTSGQWQTIETDTCYYQPPILQFPNALLTQVAIQFTINVYDDLVTKPDAIVYYLGTNLGYSQTQIPIYYSPTPTPTPTLTSTSTPIPISTPTSNPTSQPTITTSPNTNNPNSQSPSPTPIISEFPVLPIIATLMITVTLSMAVLTVIRKQKKVKT